MVEVSASAIVSRTSDRGHQPTGFFVEELRTEGSASDGRQRHAARRQPSQPRDRFYSVELERPSTAAHLVRERPMQHVEELRSWPVRQTLDVLGVRLTVSEQRREHELRFFRARPRTSAPRRTSCRATRRRGRP